MMAEGEGKHGHCWVVHPPSASQVNGQNDSSRHIICLDDFLYSSYSSNSRNRFSPNVNVINVLCVYTTNLPLHMNPEVSYSSTSFASSWLRPHVNTGIFNFAHTHTSPALSLMSNPQSAKIKSPGNSLLRRPLFSVTCLSLPQPPDLCRISVERSILKGESFRPVCGRQGRSCQHTHQKHKTQKPSVVLHLCIIFFKRILIKSFLGELFLQSPDLLQQIVNFSTLAAKKDVIPAVLQSRHLSLRHPIVKHHLLLQLHPSGQQHLVVQVQHDPL